MDSFEEYLAQNRDKYMSVITPGGNHGDTLIHMGLIKKLNEFNIEHSCFNLEKLYRKNPIIGVKYLINIAFWRLGYDHGFKLIDLSPETEHILFEGGGYLNDIWYGPILFRQVMKRTIEPIAVGPQSYLFTRTRFKEYFQDKPPVYLFCREKYSEQHLIEQNLPENVHISVSPELALYLTKEDIEDYIETRTDNYTLLAFRKDKESTISSHTKKTLLDQVEKPLISDISIEKTLTNFVSTVYNAEYIYTDRLHVAILSKILGKPATLFENKYHKNRGVWELSLKESINYREK
jgi:exopolysaccharide biosynthesis predicted pyruvyltransferase EpsI